MRILILDGYIFDRKSYDAPSFLEVAAELKNGMWTIRMYVSTQWLD